MGGHLADGKYDQSGNKYPGIGTDGQYAHSQRPQRDSRDHGGQGGSFLNNGRDQQLQGDNGPRIDHCYMLGFKLPGRVADKQPQKTVDGIVYRCHVHVIGQVPEYGIEHLEIENPETAVYHDHQYKTIILQHQQYAFQHFREGFGAGRAGWLFENEQVEQQHGARTHGSHNENIIPSYPFQERHQNKRENKCPQVDRPVKDAESQA